MPSDTLIKGVGAAIALGSALAYCASWITAPVATAAIVGVGVLGAVQYCRQARQPTVGERMAQLMAEGHGPQRHSSAASQDEVKRRACFNIDPASSDQTEHGSNPPKLHKCAATSSRILNDAEYVRAEAIMRAKLMASVCPNGNPVAIPIGRQKISEPLTNIFPNPNAACEGFRDPNKPNRQKVMTVLGVTVQVPLQGGVQPYPNFGIGNPPPTPAKPFTFPQPPPPNSHRRRLFTAVAENAVKQGSDPQSAMNALSPLLPVPLPQDFDAGPAQQNALANALPLPPPPLRPPPTAAQFDQAAMNAIAAATVPVVFHNPAVNPASADLLAIYEPVNPNVPCGPWRLVTMYPKSL